MTGEVAKVSDNSTIAGITEGAGFYTSLSLQTRADKMTMLRAVNNSVALLDKVGSEIAVVDVILQSAQFTNEETGVIDDTVRTTLIDAEGNAFHAASKGIALSLRQAFNVLGTPDTWDEPLVVTVGEGRTGKNRYLTLSF